VVLDSGLGREFGGRSHFPLGFRLGSGLSAGGCDVDKVLIEKNVKRYVRHRDSVSAPREDTDGDKAVVFCKSRLRKH
jgi:hypothetical protein